MTRILVKDDYLPLGVYNSLLERVSNITPSDKPENTILDYNPTPEISNYLNFFNKKRGYNKLNTLIHLASTPPNYTHHLHDEAEHKIMSAIIYLGPNKSYGTRFVLDGKEKEIEWIPNRLMIFCGETNVTWHDFRSGNHIRHTYNYFVVDPTKIKNEEFKKVLL